MLSGGDDAARGSQYYQCSLPAAARRGTACSNVSREMTDGALTLIEERKKYHDQASNLKLFAAFMSSINARCSKHEIEY